LGDATVPAAAPSGEEATMQALILAAVAQRYFLF